MKKILLFIVLFFATMTQVQAVTIKKTASNNNPHIGEVFEYTISISGITNLSQLGRIEDYLDPNLDFISSDFNSGSTLFAFYNSWCPTSLSGLTQPPPYYTGGALIFNFPAAGLCSGSGFADVSFKIKVALKADACNLGNGAIISNQVKLFDQSGSLVPIATSTIDSQSDIKVNLDSPWTLTKTFRSFTAGYLIYDVRLSSSVGEYNMNVLPSATFTDNFTTSPCIGADVAGSTVEYYPNGFPGTSSTVAMASATVPGMDFMWNLPPSPSGNTLSSYLFQVKIKTTSCSCTGTPFNLLNHAEANLTDICGITENLTSDFNLMNATCSGSVIVPPDEAKLCASKKVVLDDNNINLTMAGCKGKYVITIKNCTSTFRYDMIKLVDIFPSSSLVNINTSGISVFPSSYTSAITSTSPLNFYTTTPLAPGGTITITIPFTVLTPLPNQFIQNCADLKVQLNDGVLPPSVITTTLCDGGIRTVPNEATVITSKKLCTVASHSCGGFTSSNFLPGDDVEYALHIYNYGTTNATNVIITDNLPANMSTNLSDIKVYKVSNYGNTISDICDVSALSNITPSTTVSLVGNKIKINFNSNILDKFTCSGITHYIIKIKGKIALTAPNGSLTNQFSTTFKEAGSTISQTQISNPVTLTVNKDQLVFTKKTATKVSQDCITKETKVDYEIWAVNLGYLPLTMNVSDLISVPAPLTIVPGFGVNKPGNITFTESTPGTPTYLSLTSTANSLNLTQYTLRPCTLVKIKYSVTYNTNNLNAGQILQVCNTAKITVGYMSKKIIDYSDATTPPILLYNGPELINDYFAAKSASEKLLIAEKMKKESKNSEAVEKIKIIPTGPIGLPLVFVPIAATKNKACVDITDCLNGSTKGCLTGSGTGNFTFKINSINNLGQVNTSLNIPSSFPKIRKIEYVLSDIRMVNPAGICKFCCSNSVLGNFSLVSPFNIGGLPYVGPAVPSAGIYKELNKIEFSTLPYISVGPATYNPIFKLPVSLNCNGNMEIVITCIVYFEDCSICYQSQAYDYRSNYTWHWPDYSYAEAINVKK